MEDKSPEKKLKRKTLSPSETEVISDTEDSPKIEELNEKNPQKKTKLTRANTPDIIQNNWDELTNSQYITNHNASSVKSHARPLAVPKDNFDVNKAKDMFVVTALSQEASRNYADGFHEKIRAGDGYRYDQVEKTYSKVLEKYEEALQKYEEALQENEELLLKNEESIQEDEKSPLEEESMSQEEESFDEVRKALQKAKKELEKAKDTFQKVDGDPRKYKESFPKYEKAFQKYEEVLQRYENHLQIAEEVQEDENTQMSEVTQTSEEVQTISIDEAVKIDEEAKMDEEEQQSDKNELQELQKSLQEIQGALQKDKEALQDMKDLYQKDTAILQSRVNIEKKKGYESFIQSTLENKRPSHVIAVIEGKSESLPKSFVFEDTAKRKHTYKLQETFIQGKNVNDKDDAKQNMHYYVREDMGGAVTISEARITSENINSKTKNKRPLITFPVGKINFETEGGSKYSMLVPHIPNDVVGNPTADQTTHDAFEAYAEQQKTTTGEMVIGYIGDTNYTAPRDDRTVPSVGGYMEDGAFISVTSSSAKGLTFFMQGVPLATNENEASFAMQQPITLNVVDFDQGKGEIATDHPSIQSGVFLTERIKGRAPTLEEDTDENFLEQDKEAASLLAQTEDEIIFQTPVLSDTQDLNSQFEPLPSESFDLERSLARLPESISHELQTPHSFHEFGSAPTRLQVHQGSKLNDVSFELVGNTTKVEAENAKPIQTNPKDVSLGSDIETNTEKEKTDNLTEDTNDSFRLK